VHTQDDESVRKIDGLTRRQNEAFGGLVGKDVRTRSHMRSQPNLVKGHDLVNRQVGSPMGIET
jgi:hypothetical protein